ncbi:MAG: hypothetical protein J6U86_03070 [Clostridia bacterium]|nr:hypothetical protein [Clostridia bacterium]
MDSESEKKFFAAANTSEGFKSYFEEIFFAPSIKKRYIIKGGPGTGKSSFIRRVAASAENAGHGVEYYYCSSDTRSLDGIVVDGTLAMLDGTAPHSYDTVLPAACDELINLGEFWRADEIFRNADAIRLLDKEKKQAYSLAYEFLRAAGAVKKCMESVHRELLLEEKLGKAVKRAFDKLGLGGNAGGAQHTRQTVALGACGEIRLDTLKGLARVRYGIDDYYDTAWAFLSRLLELARKGGCECFVSYDNFSPSCPTEIYFPECSVWFGASDAPEDIRINMKRFIDHELLTKKRSAYRASRRCFEVTREMALSSLSRAGRAHSKLEAYYVSNMDFARQSEYCSRFIGALSL